MTAPIRDGFGRYLKAPKAKKQRARDEAMTQRAFAQWCGFCLPRTVLAFSIPNEGAQNKAAPLIAIGLYPGAADYCVIYGGQAHFIEFKSAKGRQSKEQRDFETHALAAGAPYAIARSSADAIDALEHWGIPHNDKRPRK